MSDAGFFKSSYTLKIGQRSFTLTPQAKIMLLSYAVMFAAALLGSARGLFRTPIVVAPTITVLIIYPIMIAYTVYLTNCLTVGSCDTLAWIFAAFGAFAASAYVIAFVAFLAVSAARVAKAAKK